MSEYVGSVWKREGRVREHVEEVFRQMGVMCPSEMQCNRTASRSLIEFIH